MFLCAVYERLCNELPFILKVYPNVLHTSIALGTEHTSLPSGKVLASHS